jgi:UMF1 family MFS transporter
VSRPPLLQRLALDTPARRAWATYDWANSAMYTTIVTALFPIYYASVAAAGVPRPRATFLFGITTTAGLVLIAVLAPLLGAIADYRANKKRQLAIFLALGAAAVASMALVREGDLLLASVLFILANIGVNGSFVFYDSLLPHVGGRDVDRLSTTGYALGYLGGGIFLLLCLLPQLAPGAFGLLGPDGKLPAATSAALTRGAFVATALWWAGFSIPLFRRVPEPPAALRPGEVAGGSAVKAGLARLRVLAAELRRYPQAFAMLVAFVIYNDGVVTIIRLATIYGEEIGIDRTGMIIAVLLVQFVGVPFAFFYGALAGRLGTKPAILLGVAIYVGITLLGWRMDSAREFFALAMLVGMVQGGVQALSRSLFASLIPRDRSGEFFGLFAVFEKFAGILGPAVFSAVAWALGSSRVAILALAAFFVIGGFLLARVDVAAGRAAVES